MLKSSGTQEKKKHILQKMQLLRLVLIEVEKFGFKPEEALLVTYDGKGQIFCQKKEKKKGN